MARVNTEYREGAKERIITAALEIAAERGWEAMTLDAIAQKIGVTTPALYSYFKNRDALQDEVVLRVIQLNQADMEATLSRDDIGVRELVREYAALPYTRLQGHSRLLSNLPIRFLENPDQRRKLARYYQKYSAITRDCLARAQARGEIPPQVDIDHATRLINTLSIGLHVTSLFMEKVDPDREIALWIEAVERILLLGPQDMRQ